MRIEEAATKMTTQYLTRVLTSFTKDLGRLEEDEARDYITRNAEELARPENIERRLDLFDVDHSTRVAVHYVLEVMLNTPGCALDERDVVERVREREQRLLDEAAKDDALQYTDEQCVDILRTVLEVAFEDGTISRDEYGLIEKLRQKLQITLKQQRIMEAKMGVFPSPGGDLHTPTELNEALLYLQRQGIIFYCNRAEDGRAVAEENCLRLKFESQQDADVCIVTAEDLKWVAENWESMTKKDAFNLAVFDQQGLLGRKRLEQVMRVLM